MKYLWLFLSVPTLWFISAFHRYFSLSFDAWYGMALFFTYGCISVTSIIVGIFKASEGE